MILKSHFGAVPSLCKETMRRKQAGEKREKHKQTGVYYPIQSHMQLREALKSGRETLWNHKPRSQAIIFEFMMELEDVGGDGQERPFRRDL